jgi:hypothetical protein
MPFIGVSYQNREKDIEYRNRFKDHSEIKKIIDAALDIGIKKLAAAAPSSSTLSPIHLQVLKNIIDEEREIKLIPCIGIPIKKGGRKIDDFRRWATYLSLEEKLYPFVTRRILDDPILNFREGWATKLPLAKPYGSKDFNVLKVDWRKFEEDLEYFVDLPVSHMEPGSEIDFLSMAKRFDLIGELLDRVKERGFRKVLFGVHHAGVTIPLIDEELNGLHGYVTPLNQMGLMMFPTKNSAEKAIRETRNAIFAIKPLAGGRLKPKTAFQYVFSFSLEGCMIGAASVKEVNHDIKMAVEAWCNYNKIR